MAYPTVSDGPPVDPPKVATQHTAAEEEFLNNLYVTLKPEAVYTYLQYFLLRTPSHLQDDMKDLITADLAIPPTPPVQSILRRSDAPADDQRRDPPIGQTAERQPA